MDLNVFYTALAATAATLLGLLFVAIQLNVNRLAGDPRSRWKALALSSFHSFTLVLTMALFAFVPRYWPIALLLAPLLGMWRQVQTWLPFWQLSSSGRLERLHETFWLLIGPALIYLGLMASGLRMLLAGSDADTQANTATCFIILLAILLRNSWRLLVEAPQEETN